MRNVVCVVKANRNDSMFPHTYPLATHTSFCHQNSTIRIHVFAVNMEMARTNRMRQLPKVLSSCAVVRGCRKGTGYKIKKLQHIYFRPNNRMVTLITIYCYSASYFINNCMLNTCDAYSLFLIKTLMLVWYILHVT